ncbi:MAG: 3-dehydroquinate synthase [Chitinophagales bacterium]
MQQISLEEYKIYITSEIGEQTDFTAVLKNYSSLFVLTDENTKKHCYPKIRSLLPPHQLIEIAAGEKEKNIETCKKLWSQLVELNADRKSLLLNLGGGVIGDMGGFVASTFKRGFDFMQIPTTLLSQVDASVGGKLGIDLHEMKNLIGVFKNPKAIFIATDFLKTLPQSQVQSGFAEVIKHGLIADRVYWNKVKGILLNQFFDWQEVVAKSVEIKKAVVEVDMHETGLRKILNFGHTIGHAVETLSLQSDTRPLLHGEAIAVGMICEAFISNQLNGLPHRELDEIVSVLRKYFSKYDTTKIPFEKLISIIQQDKKNVAGRFSFSLLNTIGSCEFDKHVESDVIRQSLIYYQNLA